MNFVLRFLTVLSISAFVVGHGFGAEPEAPEYDTGRPRPPIAGFPVMGEGLSLGHGYYRGVPKGELAGWTVSFWIHPDSEKRGEIFNVVLDEKQGAAIRLVHESGGLTLSGPRRNRDWSLQVPKGADPGAWHHVAIAYAQATGPALYLDGKPVGQGERGWLGYATSFDNYHFGAGIRAGGEFGDYFDGKIDDFLLYERPLASEEIDRLLAGEEIRESLVGFNDFENVNHRDLAHFSASDRDEKYLEKGRQLYEVNCVSCHSKDGKAPPINPLSRMFTKHPMENGGDPLSMFRTVTYGFRNMMPAVQLNPEERYKVIHFLREVMIKEQAPELYVAVGPGYTDIMPQNPESAGEEAARATALARTGYLRDFGHALISPVRGRAEENNSNNALTIDLGNEVTLGYDLGTMRSIGAWRGGFLNFENTLHHKLRAPALPSSRDFAPIPSMEQWRWSWDGRAENEVPDRAPLTVWPENQVRYLGHYPWGKEEIVIAYTVQGRRVLESPQARYEGDGVAIHRRLSVDPGERSIKAVVFGPGKERPVVKGMVATADGRFARFDAKGDAAEWRVAEGGELVLHIPDSKTPIHLDVALANRPLETKGDAVDLAKRLDGGSARWPETHTLEGKLAVSAFQGYALDSVPVPLKNAYGSWMRTSCLAFFPDGRLAVGTLAGDVWIVTGIDESLEKVTWKRFAAGLYEPMGMKVVDGVLTVGTRGRIVKLHDFDGNGEADFYQAFFNEPEPDPGWHAYSFDLEVGEDGSYYYARVGGFSDWSIPGGMVRVASDGSSWEVMGAGMRVPNGVGILPDGRVTFSDNQGTFVPASKIAVTRHGDFHGAGLWPDRKGDYDPEKIVEPIIYMPQELDSSSGSQLWVDSDDRFGPLGGHYFHVSYGRARTLYLMLDEVGDGVTQAAAFPLPLRMESGTMRIARNPVDGQLYTSGMTGWQAGATREGSIQRIRFTGEAGLYVVDARARKGRVELVFNRTIDPASLEDRDAWKAEAWNYQWSKGYGSPHFKVTDPGTEGTDLLEVDAIELVEEGRKLVVRMPGLQPCHTLKLDFSVKDEDGRDLTGPLYFTIHRLPE